ncbi:glycosyltransferase family 25 protein [uncultured Tateyamaria sp.]|uniref:glycosyltransferase family 25 protein n=1 Tax=uncultured Tateyamaria sp. TaxID=455651 RepID=UPI0026252A72|nr:glycosyltransferase family 25 protein [uncultured Tateyamaria sp.]
MSIRTYILSLPNDEERRRFCRHEFLRFGLNFEFIDAISGDQLEEAHLASIYDANMNTQKFKRPLSQSEIACAFGHQRIWKRVVDSKHNVSLVLEDDATFIQDPRIFLKALDQYSECFKNVVIKLDGATGRNARFFREIADQKLVLRDRLPARTTGYIIGQGAAERLLKSVFPIARPIDINLKFYWEHNVPILVLRQAMIAERLGLASTIEACRDKLRSGSYFDRFLRNMEFQFKYTCGRLRNPVNWETAKGLDPILRAEFEESDQP